MNVPPTAPKPWLDRAAKALSRDESARIARVLAPLPRDLAVLEVGCGFGRKLGLLRSLGFADLTGVDRNPEVAAQARNNGFAAYGEDAFEQECAGRRYDLLVMAHVIEHLAPEPLLAFLDGWLGRVKPGGWVFIVTPMPGRDFWLDFDHVKPYTPQSIKDFLGEPDAQVQRYGRRVLKLKDLQYRRSPFRLRHCRPLVLKTPWAVVPRAVNLLLASLFFVSGGLVGRTTGWMGLYKVKR